MSEQINSISIADVIWMQVKVNRISFWFKGMPKDVHFTLAWNQATGRTNLHLTRNIGDGSDKPRVGIVEADKPFKEKLAKLVPPIILAKIFQPLSFKKYSRKERKNIWLMFADELEKNIDAIHIEEELSLIWRKGSRTKKNRVTVPDIDQLAAAMAGADGLKKIMSNNIRRLKKDSFNSSSLRLGFIHNGKKIMPFISGYGQCCIAKKGLSFDVIFRAFADPEFAETLMKYVDEAFVKIAKAESRKDTTPDRPFILHMKEAG